MARTIIRALNSYWYGLREEIEFVSLSVNFHCTYLPEVAEFFQ